MASYGLYYSDYLPDLGAPPSLFYAHPMPQPALAEVLKAAGYATAIFQTGFLDYLELRFLFQAKGMDTLVGALEMVDKGAPLAYSAGVHEERTVQEMTQWIRAHKDQKFFVAYLTEFPHHPYLSLATDNPLPPTTWLNRYKNSMHYTDESVGKLVEFLRSEKLLDQTLIVVVGDHGETVSTYPVGHGLAASAEEMCTPCIFNNAKLFPVPAQSQLCTNHLDVAPTIVSLLGLTPPQEWLGRNLLAQSIPSLLQFVTITHLRHTQCVLDDGLLYDAAASPSHAAMMVFSICTTTVWWHWLQTIRGDRWRANSRRLANGTMPGRLIGI